MRNTEGRKGNVLKNRIAVLTPIRHRHEFIEVALNQFAKIPDTEISLFYFFDRPTPQVMEEIQRLALPQRDNLDVWLREMPFPIVEGQEGDFPKAWDWMMKYAAKYVSVSHMGIWDDDMILTNPEELGTALRGADLVYGRKVFFWDNPGQINDQFDHNSVVFFRYLPGDSFHEKKDLQVHAPREVHDSSDSRKVQLQSFIFDYGFLTPEYRKLVFEREKRTGKIDGFTRPLVEEPKLRRLPDALQKQSKTFAQEFKS